MCGETLKKGFRVVFKGHAITSFNYSFILFPLTYPSILQLLTRRPGISVAAGEIMTVLSSLDLNQNEANKVSVTFACSVFTIMLEQKRYWPHVTQVFCAVRINEKFEYFAIFTFF